MERWHTHQLVAGGLLDQPGRLWREIEAALDEEALYFQEKRAIQLANERLKREAAARETAASLAQNVASAEAAANLALLLEV